MKNNVLVIGLLALIIGLFLGYSLAPRIMMDTETMVEMHDEMEGMANHDEMKSENGSMQHSMDEMMRGLKGKTGEEFEKAFLEMMIIHHIGAIEMAEGLLEQTDKPELIKMGNDIISVQTKEVDVMKTWLNDWFSL